MKKSRSIITLAVVLVSSLLLFTACKDHRTKGAFMMDYFTEALDLTSEQQENLSEMRAEILSQVEATQEDKKQMYSTLKSQLTGEEIDKEVVRQLIAEHRAQTDTIIDLAVEKIAEFHSSLSAEQKDKLIAKLEKFRHYRNNRFHH